MILQSLDELSTYVYPQAQIRLCLANVTDTSRTLERNHLCGPIAGLVQAEMVGAAALLGTLLERPGQTITLRTLFPEGLLGGATIECSQAFHIRGYTRQKVLPSLDDSEAPCEELFDRALGHTAHCSVVRAEANGASESACFDLKLKERLTITDIVEEYFCTSLQRRVLVQLSAMSKLGYVGCAHALLCEFLPEAEDVCYDRIAARFAEGVVQDTLDAGASIGDVTRVLGLETPQRIGSTPVAFACPCSSARVMAMLRALPQQELREMAAAGKPIDIFCHMCGKCYTITPAQLLALMSD